MSRQAYVGGLFLLGFLVGRPSDAEHADVVYEVIHRDPGRYVMVADGQVHHSPEGPRDGVQSLETLAKSRIVLDDLALEGIIHRRIEPHPLDRDRGRAAPDDLVINEHAGGKFYCPKELLLLVGRAERVGKMHGLGLFAEQVLVILLLLGEGRKSEQYGN